MYRYIIYSVHTEAIHESVSTQVILVSNIPVELDEGYEAQHNVLTGAENLILCLCLCRNS